jgi:carboxymethylenebutenolidase
MYEAMLAETVSFYGANSEPIIGYLARPLTQTSLPSVVVIHHMPGWDESTKEITRKFATNGYVALCPHLHYRYGKDLPPDDAAAKAREQGGVPDDQVIGDIKGAIEYLRNLPYTNKKVGAIGYCSGGRQAFLAGCRLDLDAVVDCYGGAVGRSTPENFPLKMTAVLPEAANFKAPLLGLFGKEDQFPTQDEVQEIAQELQKHGKTFEFHSYDGAGHAFFDPARDSYRVHAARDGWEKIWAFFGKWLKQTA